MNYKRILALLVTMGILLLGVRQVTGQQEEPHNLQGRYGYAFTYQGQLKDAGGHDHWRGRVEHVASQEVEYVEGVAGVARFIERWTMGEERMPVER